MLWTEAPENATRVRCVCGMPNIVTLTVRGAVRAGETCERCTRPLALTGFMDAQPPDDVPTGTSGEPLSD